MSDYIYTLPSGTELSVEAALGDLSRAVAYLATEYAPDDWDGEDSQGLAADLGHVAELLTLLSGTASKPASPPASESEAERQERMAHYWPTNAPSEPASPPAREARQFCRTPGCNRISAWGGHGHCADHQTG